MTTEELYVVATITKRFRNRADKNTKIEAGGASHLSIEADGLIDINQILRGKYKVSPKKKPLGVNFDAISPERIRGLSKNTQIQIGGYIKELTKTQDCFYATRLIIESVAATKTMQSQLAQNPQQKRNELIRNEIADSLADADEEQIHQALSNQNVQKINDLLCSLNYSFDLEVAYNIAEFFSRRAKTRGYDSVSAMLDEHPEILADMAFLEPKFSTYQLYPRLEQKLSEKVAVLVHATSLLEMMAHHGDSFCQSNKLSYMLLEDVHSLTNTKDKYDFISSIFLNDLEALKGKIKSAGDLRLFSPKRHFGAYMDKIKSYFKDKLIAESDEPDIQKITNTVNSITERLNLYLIKSFFAERAAANNLVQCLGEDIVSPAFIKKIDRNLKLDQEQANAIKNALIYRTSVIIGGAGTGKTRVAGEISKLAIKNGDKVLFLAPSAKAAVHAASVARKIVGDSKMISCSTIARYILQLPADEDMGIDADLPLDKKDSAEYRFIIVDEMSMCTIPMFAKILHIIKDQPHTHLILIGDDKQLPAIGQQFYHQICDGILDEYLPVTRLYVNHRAKDALSVFTDYIREGFYNPPKANDQVNIYNTSAEDFISRFPELVKDPETLFLVNKVSDAKKLNKIIRNLRMGKRKKEISGTDFYIHDHVITTQNDYFELVGKKRDNYRHSIRHPDRDINVFNGSDGIIESYKDDTVWVRIFAPDAPEEGILVPYYPTELAIYFQPAYALTIHKAQGSQAKKVVLCLNESKVLTNRNAIYTAVTRAQDALYIIDEHTILPQVIKKSAHHGLTFFAFFALASLDEKHGKVVKKKSIFD